MVMDIKIKTLTKLNKLFNTVENNNQYTDEEILKLEHCTVMTADSVLMMIPKTNDARLIVKPFLQKEEDKHINKEPSLNYSENTTRINNGSLFNIVYLKRVLEVLECDKETVHLTTGTDFPITLENEQFKFILAPRIKYD